MEILTTVLTVVYVFCCLFLGFVVLIQKGEGGGLGGAFGGGAVDVAFGAKADMTWKRATAAAATLFMVLAVVIGMLQERVYTHSGAESSATGTKAPEKGDGEETDGEKTDGEKTDGEKTDGEKTENPTSKPNGSGN